MRASPLLLPLLLPPPPPPRLLLPPPLLLLPPPLLLLPLPMLLLPPQQRTGTGMVATKQPRRGAFLVFSSDPMVPDNGRLAFEAAVGVLIGDGFFVVHCGFTAKTLRVRLRRATAAPLRLFDWHGRRRLSSCIDPDRPKRPGVAPGGGGGAPC